MRQDSRQALCLRNSKLLALAACTLSALLLFTACTTRNEIAAAGQTTEWHDSSKKSDNTTKKDADLVRVDAYFAPGERPIPKNEVEFYELAAKVISSISDCVVDKGWDPIELNNPNTPFFTWVDQDNWQKDAKAYERDVRACAKLAGPMPKPATLDAEYYSKEYDAELKAYECFKANGVTGLSDPPSREKYVDDGLHKKPEKWSPHTEAIMNGPYGQEKLYEMCPWAIQ